MEEENKNAPKLISIKELDGMKFVIPSYQRGFRWTYQQLKELMDDLCKFFESDQFESDQNVYCLQNITVRKIEENKYEVIDGQQRLTALWIVTMLYLDNSSSTYTDKKKIPKFLLSYEGKDELTNYVNAIDCCIKSNVRQSSIQNIPACQDIDSSYIYAGIKSLIENYYFVVEASTLNQCLNDIFCTKYDSDKKRICFIWNEIETNKTADGCKDDTNYAIEKFSNINANKIPLTEAELIKAYFINSIDGNKIALFTLQWEEIERGLNDDDFWYFITSGTYIETRIDFLFEVQRNSEGETSDADRHSLSRYFSERMTNNGSAWKLWYDCVVPLYYKLRDWYNDYYFYHMAGLLVAIGKPADTPKTIYSLYSKYNGSTKEVFKSYLKKRIRTSEKYEKPFLIDKNTKEWKIFAAEDIHLDDDLVRISYTENKECIKPILLLFNVSLLLNAYENNPKNTVERFSFKTYKDKDNPIEIEHINPQHLIGRSPDGAEYTSQHKYNWAMDSINIIDNERDKSDLLGELGKDASRDLNSSLIKKIEEKANLHSLSNLTLIDKKLNISYGDNFFDEKRNNILSARFGYYLADGRCQNNSVIFPGTMWVFMREYIKDDNRAESSSKSQDVDRWTAEDRNQYIECMKNSIFTLLKDDTTLDENTNEENAYND